MKKKFLNSIFALFIAILLFASYQSYDSFENTNSDYALNFSQDAQERIEKINYVGSKNSDVYHYPDCHYADRIKPENRIWFS